MEIIEIERIVYEKVKILENSESPTYKRKNPDGPNFNPIYRDAVKLRDRIAVHTELDKKPYHILDHRGPYENDLQYNYRVKNWASITMPYFMKALGKLNRIMNPSNYGIQWPDGMDEDQKNYFYNDIPIFRSIQAYFEQIVIVQKIVDPNSLMVIRPYYLPVRYEEQDGQMQAYLDDSVALPVTPSIIPCQRVIAFKEGVYAMIELEEKSEVEYYGVKERTGYVFEFYDSENIYRIEQYGKKTDWLFTKPMIYYPHKLGYLPAQKLKGIPLQKDMEVLYQSYYINAIPHLDVALYGYSNLDMSCVTQMFPQRSEFVDRCDEPQCEGGYIITKEEIGEGRFRTNNSTCPKCKGSGTISLVGPMMVKQIAVGSGFNDENPGTKYFPGVAYTAPPSDPLEFVYKKYKDDIEAAFSFVHMDSSNTKLSGEPALSKKIDREELFAFIMKISNEVFQLLSFAIDTMGRMRYGLDFKTPKIVPPTSFAIRDEEDLLSELVEGKEASVPDIAQREIVREYMSKRFSNLRNVDPVINLAFLVDRFITANQTEMASKLAIGIASKSEAILHDSLYTFIDEIIESDPGFFDKPLDVQKSTLIKMAQDKEAEISAPAKGSTKSVTDMANDDE